MPPQSSAWSNATLQARWTARIRFSRSSRSSCGAGAFSQPDPVMRADKQAVQDFWERASCGEQLYLQGAEAASYLEQARQRYELEPYIEPFADFSGCAGQQVLEVGVGLGADHQRFAQAGARLSGIDLTERAIAHTRRRLSLLGLESALAVGDAENLPFGAATFDVVYSWGVIHHS